MVFSTPFLHNTPPFFCLSRVERNVLNGVAFSVLENDTTCPIRIHDHLFVYL